MIEANKKNAYTINNRQLSKQGDSMADNLNMRNTIIRGLTATYPHTYRGDEAVSWRQAVCLTHCKTQFNLYQPQSMLIVVVVV